MLFEQIRANRRKTRLLVTVFVLLVLGIGWAVGYLFAYDGLYGLAIAALIALFYVPITYATATAQVLSFSGAREVSEEDAPELVHIVEELSLVAGVKTPKVYIIDDPSPNAFAAGIKKDQAVVAVTRGLLEKLNREELEGVIAHEMSHIRHEDVRLMTIAIALVGVIVLIADFGSRILFFGGSNNRRRDRNGSGSNPILLIIALVLLILAPLAAQFVRFALSRNREYLADAGAVELTRNPQGLIRALEKIRDDTYDVERANAMTEGMYFAQPRAALRKKIDASSWFSTHPPIEKRLERLKHM
ncbi:MAG: zinc metalloprotease HtpX [Candidatus Carbobacillus altaicus]|nr:zinc metalloprotease HtpX [Candidatus Carbobacillus altaicus]